MMIKQKEGRVNESGQSLFEILIAVAIGTIIIASATSALVLVLRSGSGNAASQKAYGLAKELLDNVSSYSEANWATLYGQTKGSGTQYHLAVTATSTESTTLGLSTSTIEVVEGDITYTTWFSIENVNRSNSGAVVTSGGVPDPSTQKVTIYVSWPEDADTKEISVVRNISHTRSNVFISNNWGGSSGETGPVTNPTNDYFSVNGLSPSATSITVSP